MFDKEKDILTGEETFKGEHTEEFEYYNMEALEKQIMKKLNVMEEKMDTILHEVEDNQHRLKGIQFQFTRALIIRLIKLAFITFVIWYVYTNFISPMIIGAGNKYYQAEQLLDRVDSVNTSSEGLLDRVKTFFPEGVNLPGDESSSTVEN